MFMPLVMTPRPGDLYLYELYPPEIFQNFPKFSKIFRKNPKKKSEILRKKYVFPAIFRKLPVWGRFWARRIHVNNIGLAFKSGIWKPIYIDPGAVPGCAGRATPATRDPSLFLPRRTSGS